jgi:hypothetical protein
MSKSITVDLDWFNIITAYAEEHCMTKKDTLKMLLDISISRKNTFYDWYLENIVKSSERTGDVLDEAL